MTSEEARKRGYKDIEGVTAKNYAQFLERKERVSAAASEQLSLTDSIEGAVVSGMRKGFSEERKRAETVATLSEGAKAAIEYSERMYSSDMPSIGVRG